MLHRALAQLASWETVGTQAMAGAEAGGQGQCAERQ